MSSTSVSSLFPEGDLFGPESVPPPRRPVPAYEQWSEHFATSPMPVAATQPPSPSPSARPSSGHHGHHAAPTQRPSSNTTAASPANGNGHGHGIPGVGEGAIPGIPGLQSSMYELIRSLGPMVEEWRQRGELELEARLMLISDMNSISEKSFAAYVFGWHHMCMFMTLI
jgi:hypothetical protein